MVIKHGPCPRCVAERGRKKLQEMLDADPMCSIDTLTNVAGTARAYLDVIVEDSGDVCEEHSA